MRVGGDDVADRTRRGEDAELTIGLIALSRTEKVSAKSFACSPSPFVRK
jgi:hypothetical protein